MAAKRKAKPKEPIKPFFAIGCLVCPKSEDGYMGFESDSRKEMAEHLRKAHQIEVLKTAHESMTLHLNAGDYYQHQKRWILPDGRQVAHITAVVPKGNGLG